MPELPPAEARRRFAAGRVAALATVDKAGRPHLVPVTFAVAGSTVVTAVDRKPKRTPRLQRLRNIAARSAVSLLVEHYNDEDWTALWWARADGDARVLPPGGADYEDAISLLTERYPQYRSEPPDGPAILIEVHRWLGWSATADGYDPTPPRPAPRAPDATST